jgi:hypothetical protein
MIDTVTQNGMVKKQPGVCVSFMSGSDIKGVILNVFRVYSNVKNRMGGFGKAKKCDDYGKQFPSMVDARRYALSKGYLKPYYSLK